MSKKSFSKLLTEKVPGERDGRQLFRLTAPLTFRLGINGRGIEITVPAGFITDFASVPRMFWPIVPPVGPYCEASVLHDYLRGQVSCSRFLADAIFREAMAQLGVPLWRRVCMYYFVRFWSVIKWYAKSER